MPLPGACMRPILTLPAKISDRAEQQQDGASSQVFRRRESLEGLPSSCAPLCLWVPLLGRPPRRTRQTSARVGAYCARALALAHDGVVRDPGWLHGPALVDVRRGW